MTDTANAEDLIADFERRVELLGEMLELAQRQRRSVEQAKSNRLDRLIARREHCVRRWGELEEQLGAKVKTAQAGTLSGEQKALLRTLIGESEALIEAITHEDDLTAEAIGTRHVEIANELDTLRKGRTTLRAYGKGSPSSGNAGVDRSA